MLPRTNHEAPLFSLDFHLRTVIANVKSGDLLHPDYRTQGSTACSIIVPQTFPDYL